MDLRPLGCPDNTWKEIGGFCYFFGFDHKAQWDADGIGSSSVAV